MIRELQPIHYGDPVDLEVLIRRLMLRLPSRLSGYESGRSQIRDAIMRELSCTSARANAMVALLEELGFIRFARSLQHPHAAAPGRERGPEAEWEPAWELILCPPRPIRS